MANVTTQQRDERSEQRNEKGPNGFLGVPRKMLHPSDPHHPMQTGEEACEAFAWLDLAALARWKEGEGLDRGEARGSERFLARRWNWSRAKVRRWLDRLEGTGRVKRVPTEDPAAPNKVRIVDYDRLFRPEDRPRGPAHESAHESAHGLARHAGENGGSPAHESAHESAQGSGPKMNKENRREQSMSRNKAYPETRQARHGGSAAAPRPPSGTDGKEAGGGKEGEIPEPTHNGNGRPAPGSEHDSGRRVAELEDGRPIYLRNTENGWRVECPNRSPTYLPAGVEPEEVAENPELARTLARLPVKVAEHPDGWAWKAGCGSTGPYLLADTGSDPPYWDLPGDKVSPLDLLNGGRIPLARRILDRLEADDAPTPEKDDPEPVWLDPRRAEGLYGYETERPETLISDQVEIIA